MSSVREAVWHGKIPLEVHLDDPDGILSVPNATHTPLYLLEFRLSYLPLLIPQIRKHFSSSSNSMHQTQHSTGNKPFISRFGSSEFDDFEEKEEEAVAALSRSHSVSSGASIQNLDGFFTAVFGGARIALPWHLPIGLLFDLNCALWDEPCLGKSPATASLHSLPFRITFHMSANAQLFVQDQLPLLAVPAQIPLDEALTSTYFAALKESDYVRCGSAKNVMNLSRTEQIQLWESVKTGQFERFWRTNAKLTGFSPKAIPVKIWHRGPDRILKRFALSVAADKENLTLKDWLATEFGSDCKCTALCHGICLPADVKLHELAQSFCYADNFLHLILINT